MSNRIALILAALVVVLGLLGAQGMNRALTYEVVDRDLPPDTPPPLDDPAPLPFRMVDLGGVGIEPDSAAWGQDYSHHVRRFHRAYRPDPPYVDPDECALVVEQFKTYTDRMAGLGFNAIVIDGFLELVDFDGVGSGFDIYPEDSPLRAHHAAFRNAYGQLYALARERGLRVIAKTDMVAFTTPLRRYFEARLGSVDVESPELWAVYQAGFEELLDRYPEIHGLMIRIGEAGAVYNTPGWDYRSELWVTTDRSVKQMLRAFLEVAERRDRVVVFRSWSVGVGQVGRIHTDPKAYERVLGDVTSDHLVVSTKYPQGDFWNQLPLNPTLFTGPHRRIVELQARREFEAFNVIPNYVAPLHQVALASFLRTNPKVEGVWVWTQGGGPLRHGPLMIYPFYGPWVWVDANVHGTARVVADPDVDIAAVSREWAAATFGDDPAVVDTIADILEGSHRTAYSGLTIPEFGRRRIKGMNVPPVIYSYWDVVGSSTSILSQIYTVVKSDLDVAVRQGFDAADRAKEVRADFAAIEDRITTGRDWISHVRGSLDYQVNLFETTAHHKQFVLRYYDWLDNGGGDLKQAWRSALDDYRAARDAHRAAHAGNLDFPAYNFEIADHGARVAHRSGWSANASRLLVVLILAALWATFTGRLDAEATAFAAGLAVVVLAAYGAFTAFSAPAFTAAKTVFVVAYLLALREVVLRDARPHAFRNALAPVAVLVVVILAITAWRGSSFFWFGFWTRDAVRSILWAVYPGAIVLHWLLVLAGRSDRVSEWTLAGRLAALVGVMLALNGLMWTVFGFETLLTRFNDELLVIPGMTSRVLGITTHLNIPLTIPSSLTVTGIALGAIGYGLARVTRTKPEAA